MNFIRDTQYQFEPAEERTNELEDTPMRLV